MSIKSLHAPSPNPLREWLSEVDEELLLFDGLDEAVLGIIERAGEPSVVLYDRERAIDILAKGGMDRADAEEYFDVNVAGARVGERTPAFAVLWSNVRLWREG